MARCSFRHFAFAFENHSHYDNTDICWLAEADVTNYGTDESPTYLCLFHAHSCGAEPLYDPTSLPSGAARLRELLERWNDSNRDLDGAKDFCLPGIRCDAIDLSVFQFSGSVWFFESHFSGDAQFQNAVFGGTAGFRDCTFGGIAGFQACQFKKRAIFKGCSFQGETYFKSVVFSGDAKFDDASFHKNAVFNHAIFSENNVFRFNIRLSSGTIDFHAADIGCRASFDQARLNNISFNKTHFKKLTSFSNAVICGAANFKNCIFEGHAHFHGVSFDGTSDFSGADFKGDVEFLKSTTFRKSVTFYMAKSAQSVTFRNVTFFDKANFSAVCAQDIVSIRDTSFSGSQPVLFRGCEFNNGLIVQDCQFNGQVDISKVTQKGEGRFLRIIWHNSVTFNDARFEDVTFNDNDFEANVTFEKAAFNLLYFERVHARKGEFCLSYITVEMHFRCNRSEFINLQLLSCQFERPCSLTGCKIQQLHYVSHQGERIILNRCEAASFSNAPTSGLARWDFSDQDCSRLAFLNMDMSSAHMLGADINSTLFISCRWRRASEHYCRVAEHEKILAENNPEQVHLLYSLYQQLKKNLEEAKDYRTSGDMHYQEMQIKRLLLRPERGVLTERVILWLYRHVADYGENYKKLAAYLFASFFAAAAIVTWLEVNMTDALWCIVKSITSVDTFTKDIVYASWVYLGAIPRYLNMVFFGVIPSGFQRGALDGVQAGLHWTSKIVIVFEGVVVVALASLFVMAIRRHFRR